MAFERAKSPADFIAFELAGWDRRIEGYDHVLGPVSRQTVKPTLDAARVEVGMRVLDVCSGPGMLAEGAIQRGATAIGLDFSGEVVEFARMRVPGAKFQRGDAQNLPFPENSFDAVICGYGIMHVPEPEVALREMKRVLRPGGRVALSVWDGASPTSAFALTYAAVRQHGTLDISLPHGPDFFQFGTPTKMKHALAEVGFLAVEADFIPQKWTVNSADEVCDALRNGTVRASALLSAQSDAAIREIRAFFAATLARYRTETGQLEVPLPAIVGSGAKPSRNAS